MSEDGATMTSGLASSSPTPPTPVDLLAAARAATQAGQAGAIWSHASTDLNLNLVRLAPGEAVAEHVNNEVDVVVIAVSGSGIVTISGQEQRMDAGSLILLPKGAPRALRALDADFVYVTCHRRRAGLMPKRATR